MKELMDTCKSMRRKAIFNIAMISSKFGKKIMLRPKMNRSVKAYSSLKTNKRRLLP
jgi:hypothetical protein